jgi:hypothetical protein
MVTDRGYFEVLGGFNNGARGRNNRATLVTDRGYFEVLGGFNNGARGRNRTTDTRIFNPLLYRLSYPGMICRSRRAREARIKPALANGVKSVYALGGT